MIGLGATFFSSREALEQSRDFGEMLASAESVDAIYIIGRSFIRDHSNRFRRIQRLILPNPTSDFIFRFYEASTGEPHLADCVRRATAICRDDIGMKVRWCPELIQQSVLIADSDKRTGWVHAEFVMPCSKANTRPSITIKKSRFEGVIHSYQDTFNRLWNLSNEPPQDIAKAIDSLPAHTPSQAIRTALSPEQVIINRLLTPGWILNFNPATARGAQGNFFQFGWHYRRGEKPK